MKVLQEITCPGCRAELEKVELRRSYTRKIPESECSKGDFFHAPILYMRVRGKRLWRVKKNNPYDNLIKLLEVWKVKYRELEKANPKKADETFHKLMKCFVS